MPQPANPKSRKVAAACAAAALVCLPLTKISEGRRLAPYRDPANIVTWCYGETQGQPKSRYTEDECARLLQYKLASKYAPKIVACRPELADEKHITTFAAMLDASYNAGPDAVCRSPMAAAVRAGDWVSACEGFYGWYVSATYRGKPHPAAQMQRAGWTWNGRNWRKVLPGLVARRIKEAAMCRGGA